MKLLTYLCVVLQVLDGLLTYCGVTFLPWGINAEGNPLLKHMMITIGVIPALILFKSFAIFFIFNIHRAGASWLFMLIVFGIYSFVVIAWIFLLFPLIA